VAIILEDGLYQKIDIRRCFINADGMYVTTTVFKNKAERDKEKERYQLIMEFVQNVYDEEMRVNSLEDAAERGALQADLQEAAYISKQVEFFVQRYENTELADVNERQLSEAEKYGFDRSWYEDPVILVRDDTIWVGQYNKPDFTLESFYNILKENIYTPANVSFTDDI
jgi:hypothetical protein